MEIKQRFQVEDLPVRWEVIPIFQVGPLYPQGPTREMQEG